MQFCMLYFPFVLPNIGRNSGTYEHISYTDSKYKGFKYKWLYEDLDRHCKLFNFADPLKNAIGEIFGFSYEQLHGKEKEIVDPFWGVTPRELFQKIGTELFQYHLPNEVEKMKELGITGNLIKV